MRVLLFIFICSTNLLFFALWFAAFLKTLNKYRIATAILNKLKHIICYQIEEQQHHLVVKEVPVTNFNGKIMPYSVKEPSNAMDSIIPNHGSNLPREESKGPRILEYSINENFNINRYHTR